MRYKSDLYKCFISPDTLVLILDYEHVSLAAHHSKMTSNPARPISQLTA